MSIAEIERFAADMKSNEGLRAEAGKHAAERHHETPIAQCVAFAGSKGYAFTADEAKQHIKAKAAGSELTDAELGGVTGGLSTAAPNEAVPVPAKWSEIDLGLFKIDLWPF